MRIQNVTRMMNAMLIVAVVLTSWRAYRWLDSKRPPGESVITPAAVGDHLAADGVDWSRARRNIVLFVSVTCPACDSSGPFFLDVYRHVQQRSDSRMVVLTPDDVSAVRTWLVGKGIDSVEIDTAIDLRRLGFTVYPTLVIVDDSGMVTDFMAGELAPAARMSVLRRIDRPDTSAALNNAIRRIGARADLADLVRNRQPQIVDVAERGAVHEPMASSVNIPADELGSRALMELDPNGAVVVLCQNIGPQKCEGAATWLRRLGFAEIYVFAPQ